MRAPRTQMSMEDHLKLGVDIRRLRHHIWACRKKMWVKSGGQYPLKSEPMVLMNKALLALDRLKCSMDAVVCGDFESPDALKCYYVDPDLYPDDQFLSPYCTKPTPDPP